MGCGLLLYLFCMIGLVCGFGYVLWLGYGGWLVRVGFEFVLAGYLGVVVVYVSGDGFLRRGDCGLYGVLYGC